MRFRVASGLKQLLAAWFLAPADNSRCRRLLARLHLRSQQPMAFQLSLFATGPFSIGTLGLVSRRNRTCDLFLSDETAGSNRLFQASIFLRKPSALKLRLERFRTSHARVLGNLLFSAIRASEIRANFVSFLFKTSPSCGAGWKRRELVKQCTSSHANFRTNNARPHYLLCETPASFRGLWRGNNRERSRLGTKLWLVRFSEQSATGGGKVCDLRDDD